MEIIPANPKVEINEKMTANRRETAEITAKYQFREFNETQKEPPSKIPSVSDAKRVEEKETKKDMAWEFATMR